MSVAELIRRLPSGVLVTGAVLLFGTLVADLVIADPLPIVDEAALLWGLVQSLRILSERRRARRTAMEQSPDEGVVADVLPEKVVTGAAGAREALASSGR
jgi:hypothetical protein